MFFMLYRYTRYCTFVGVDFNFSIFNKDCNDNDRFDLNAPYTVYLYLSGRRLKGQRKLNLAIFYQNGARIFLMM